MTVSRLLVTTLLVGSAAIGAACTAESVDESKRDVGAAIDDTRAGANSAIEATQKAGDKTADAGRNAVQKAADGTKEVAGAVAEKSKDVALAAGAAVTDGWVTTKVKTKFADETVLEGSDINVDTTDHVVTLRGRVRSSTARSRAGEIAAGTEGVTRVINELVVREM